MAKTFEADLAELMGHEITRLRPKAGDRVSILIGNRDGRRVQTISRIVLRGDEVYAKITPESSGGALKRNALFQLILPMIRPSLGDAEWEYRTRADWAALLPPRYWTMKTGDLIQLTIINRAGRRVETIARLRIKEARFLAEITPESSGGALKQKVNLELVPPLIVPSVGEAEFRYRGDQNGATLVPDMFWK